MRRPRRFFLAVHGVEGDDAVRDMEFAEQLLRGGDFVGLVRDIDVRQDETGFDLEGVQYLGRLAVGEIVEASSERLAIDRDDTSCRIGNGAAQTSGVLAENLLDHLGLKALEDVSNRAGARRQCRPKAAFNRRRCTLMKVTIER